MIDALLLLALVGVLFLIVKTFLDNSKSGSISGSLGKRTKAIPEFAMFRMFLLHAAPQ